MEDLEEKLDQALKKSKELIEKNVLLTKSNSNLMKELEKTRAENLKNDSLINELNIWVQNLTEINTGNHEAFQKINQVKFN